MFEMFALRENASVVQILPAQPNGMKRESAKVDSRFAFGGASSGAIFLATYASGSVQ